MPFFPLGAITGLSCVLWFVRISVVCLLVLSAAEIAAAQTLTANGSSNAIAVYRGDVAINATGSGHSKDWVGLYPVGAPSGYPHYRDWFYLNGAKSIPSSPVGAASFPFPIFDTGQYQFRLHRGDTYAVIAVTGTVTVQPPTMNVNGVVAPQTVTSRSGGTIQVNVFGGAGHTQDWVGIYRIGAADTAWSDWLFLNGTRTVTGAAIRTTTLSMTMPLPRGPYEVRWFHGNSYTRIATSTLIHSEVSTIAAGGDGHTLMVRPSSTAWGAGFNASAQLGDGSTTDRAVPAQIAGLSNVVSVAAGASHSLAITASGALHTWGANDAGQLGDDTTTQRTIPTELPLANVVAIAAGEQHSVALTASGQLYTWGLNASGQLGNGSTTDSDVPIQIATGVIAIGAGDHFTLFVKADGSVWGMGDNEFGALGDGTMTTPRLSPVQMVAVSGVIAVQGGQKHSLILQANGHVYATGRNDLGQLGEAVTNRSIPIRVAALSNMVGIAAGDAFSLALDKDGGVWAWGDNASGQLGVATPATRTAPEVIQGLSGITFIGAGDAFAIAVNANGMVTTFGDNGFGQLGDGTTMDRSTPAASEGFSERLATPTFTVAAGTYANNFNVIVNHAIAGSTLRYTQNGSDPTESDSTIAAGASVLIEQSQTLKVKAWKNGWLPSAVSAAAYEMKAIEPSFSPPAGTFSSPTAVTMTTATPGAVVRYTVDGTAPTAASPHYAGPIAINTSTTLRAAAFKANWSASHMSEGAYAMNFGTLGSPTVEPATGTYVGGTTVTMSTAHSGAVVRFTTNGDAPTANSALYTSPISVDGTMTVKAKAFHSDYTASAETTRTYTIAAAPPTISPSTGTYASAQTITITPSVSAMTVRYTLDGSDPTEGSTAYAAPFTIDTGTTIKARAFPNSPLVASSVVSASLSFNYGAIAAPTASPAGGVYADAQQITLSATAGATIRFTTDGTEPTTAADVYVAPLLVSSGNVAIKARAFHPDWVHSSITAASYTIDTTAPSIITRVRPRPNSAEWNNTDVTVSFVCSDNLGAATCPSPVIVTADGSGQVIHGTATDTAGNFATGSVVVNIDSVPPEVMGLQSLHGLVTPNPVLELTATATDLGSGVAKATCNGRDANLVGAEVSCWIDLRPGVNPVVVHVTDVAGNTKSIGARVHRIGPATRLTLTPTHRTILVGEVEELSLKDDFGSTVTGASWVTSDPAVVAITSDDPPTFVGNVPGAVTITASKNGLTATATVTVVAGVTIPEGTTVWSVAPTPVPGLATYPPIYTNRVEFGAADLFTVEWDAQFTVSTLRAITSAGDFLWSAELEGDPLMADNSGGLIFGIGNSRRGGLGRLPGSVAALPWRYESPGTVDTAAQAPDGTVYVVETLPTGFINSNGSPVFDKRIVTLNGLTGDVISRLELEPDVVVFQAEMDGQGVCRSTRNEYEPQTVGPVIGVDGYAYLLKRGYSLIETGLCDEGEPLGPRQVDRRISLLKLAATGIVSATEILADHCAVHSTVCDVAPNLGQVVPDLVEGILVTWTHAEQYSSGETRLTRITSSGQRTDRVVPSTTTIGLVSDTGIAYVVADGVTRAVEVETWQEKATIEGRPVMALDGREVITHDGATLKWFDATGGLKSTSPLIADVTSSVTKQAEWISYDQDFSHEGKPLRSIVGPAATEAKLSFQGMGGPTRQFQAYASCVDAPFLGELTPGLSMPRAVTAEYDYKYAFSSLIPSQATAHMKEGFDLWDVTVTAENLGFRFTPDTTGQPAIDIGPALLNISTAALTGNWVTSEDGRDILGASVRSTNNPAGPIRNPRVWRKVFLHEVGHLVGLDDRLGGFGKHSVMNKMGGRDDRLGYLPWNITVCDRDRAIAAQIRPWP